MLRTKIVRRLAFGIAAATAAIFAGLPAPADAAFRFKKIVDEHTPLPDGSGNFNLFNNTAPQVSGNWVVFNGADAVGNVTIWRSNLAGRKLRRLITQQTVIPGWKDNDGNRLTFNQLSGHFSQVSGETLVLVALPCAGCNSGVGIFARSLFGGPISKLVDKNDEHPDISKPNEDKHFGNFSEDFNLAEGLVVFSNRGKVFTVPIAGGDITRVAGASTEINNVSPPCPYCPIFGIASLRGEKVLLRAGNVFGSNSIQSVRSNGASRSWAVVASDCMHAPKTPANHRFNRFEFWGPVIDESMVFGGGSALRGENPCGSSDVGPYIKGIYSSSDRLRRLADSNMPVPGGTGNFDFSWLGSRSPIVAANGIVVFGAQDADGKQGLYAVRQTGGRIRKIIAVGDPIGAGFTVGGLAIGRGALDGSTLVFTVGYANFQGIGLYSTQVVLP